MNDIGTQCSKSQQRHGKEHFNSIFPSESVYYPSSQFMFNSKVKGWPRPLHDLFGNQFTWGLKANIHQAPKAMGFRSKIQKENQGTLKPS